MALAENFVQSLLSLGILFAVGIIIYLKVKKITFMEFIKDINMMGIGKNGK